MAVQDQSFRRAEQSHLHAARTGRLPGDLQSLEAPRVSVRFAGAFLRDYHRRFGRYSGGARRIDGHHPTMAVSAIRSGGSLSFTSDKAPRPRPSSAVLASEGVRVIAPEIAELVRKELIGVVENGTARRAHGGIVLAGGKVLPVGGKTGTGDNRLESFTAHGALIGSKVVNRTATFVFMSETVTSEPSWRSFPARKRRHTASPARSRCRSSRTSRRKSKP